MQILVLNPNTSPLVSERLRERTGLRLAELDLADTHRIRTITASIGPSYISSEVGYAVAAHAALDAWARDAEAGGVAEAILLGCFGDPGVQALREASGLPVIGLAEAAMRRAARLGRFSIVTGGAAWVPMLERLARGFGLGDALVAVHAVAPTGAALAADPAGAIDLLGDACVKASRGVEAVILGGAGLAGYAAPIAPRLDCPLIDSVDAGLDWLLREPLDTMRLEHTGPRPDWLGLSAALELRLR